VRALWRQLVAEAPPPYPTHIGDSVDVFTRSVALALTSEPPTAFIFLGQLAGSIGPDAFLAYEIQQRALGRPERMAFVHYAYTVPGARGHGLGTAVAEIAAEHMLAQGLRYCEITTLPDSTAWADLGFTPYELRQWCPLDGVSTHIAERRRRWLNGRDSAADAVQPFEQPPEEEPDDESP
jgi:GNAT superfamily N-acetyltransferase